MAFTVDAASTPRPTDVKNFTDEELMAMLALAGRGMADSFFRPALVERRRHMDNDALMAAINSSQ